MIKLLNILFTQLKAAMIAFVPIQIVWALLFIVLRFVEFWLETIAHALPKFWLNVIYIGLLKDISFILTASFWMFLFFYLLFVVQKKIAIIVYTFVAIVVALVQFILTIYFITTLVPLGADLWSYSWADIVQTVGAAAIHWTKILLLVIMIILFIAVFLKLPKRFKLSFKAAFVFVEIMSDL